jgi:hypothetical protein
MAELPYLSKRFISTPLSSKYLNKNKITSHKSNDDHAKWYPGNIGEEDFPHLVELH